MARTTRSSATVAQPPPVEIQPKKTKNKKRKRDSVVENEDQPAAKLQKQEEPEVVPSVLDPAHAQQILDILEMVDTQGLLDRIFPLSTETSDSAPVKSCSFRTLLREPQEHDLRILRCAIQHLFPISSHSRSRASTPGAQQLRFCNLALSLLDQASQVNAPISLDIESLQPLVENDTSTPAKRRKFALMQKFPSGEWWTSLNSDISAPGSDIKDLGTGHAELVSILPAPSTSALNPDLPTLGSYVPKKASTSKRHSIGKHRWVSRGSFLDYGRFASFAPTFQQEGKEVGRVGFGEVLFAEKRYEQRAKAAEKLRRKRLKEIHGGDIDMVEADDDMKLEAFDLRNSLKGLLTEDEVDSIQTAMEDLDLQSSAQELLERNARALVRLEELQMERLLNKTGFKPAQVGSEEWDTAQAIANSLAVLASLRPRTSKDESVVPPASILRNLHQTLPLEPSVGWYGNLPTARATALRDDTTIHLKSAAMTVAIDPALRAGPSKPVATTTQYAPYPTTSYQTTMPYAATAYPTMNQSSYYQNYGNSNTTAYTQQQYSAWYGGYQNQAASGRATPMAATNSTMYQPPSNQRAVANTVANKSQQNWPGGATAPYLPAHMRDNGGVGASVSQPGTPGPYHATLR